MAAAPSLAGQQAIADFRAALQVASRSTTTNTRRASSSYFGKWVEWCQGLHIAPSLRSLPDQETKLAYLLSYGLRFRRSGMLNKSVRADTVEKALRAVGQGITLDGQQSADADGDLITFVWSLQSAPAGSLATLSDATSVRPNLTPDVAGTYQLQLLVNDGKTDSVPATVTSKIPPINSPLRRPMKISRVPTTMISARTTLPTKPSTESRTNED